MSKRFKQVNVQHFATLLRELDVDLMTQPQFVREIDFSKFTFVTKDFKKFWFGTKWLGKPEEVWIN